jgi:hypothetical protein
MRGLGHAYVFLLKVCRQAALVLLHKVLSYSLAHAASVICVRVPALRRCFFILHGLFIFTLMRCLYVLFDFYRSGIIFFVTFFLAKY